jgi:DNA-binding transcriptional LysR family regulator
LRVGTFQSASARLLPPTLNRFRELFPKVRVELRNEHSGTVIEELIRAGQLDLGFSDSGAQIAPLASTPLIEDEYVVMVPPDNPLSNAPFLRLSDLKDMQFISGSADSSCESRILGALERAGARPQTVFRSDDNLTTQRLVASGLGIAIAPLLAVELMVPDAAVSVLPIVDDLLTSRTIAIVWHQDRYRSRAAEAFVETAVSVAANIAIPTVPVTTSNPAPSMFV